MPLAAAATTSVLLLARRSSCTTASLARRCFRRLCPVRVQRGEDPHLPLSPACATAAASHWAEPQLLAG